MFYASAAFNLIHATREWEAAWDTAYKGSPGWYAAGRAKAKLVPLITEVQATRRELLTGEINSARNNRNQAARLANLRGPAE